MSLIKASIRTGLHKKDKEKVEALHWVKQVAIKETQKKVSNRISKSI